MSDCGCNSSCSSEKEPAVSAISMDSSEINAEFLSEFKVPKMDCPSEEGYPATPESAAGYLVNSAGLAIVAIC